jgi:trigger factor
MYGKETKAEVLDKVIKENIDTYIRENNIRMILQLLPSEEDKDINWDGDNFIFHYDIGLQPDFNPKVESLDLLPKYDVEVDEKELDTQINSLKEANAQREYFETVPDEMGISIGMEFQELDASGAPFEGGQSKFKIYLTDELPTALMNFLAGKEKHFKGSFQIKSLLTQEEIKTLLSIDDLTFEDIEDNFQISLLGIFKKSLPEMNQEFFDRYFEPGTVTTEEDFRSRWKEIVKRYYDQETEMLFHKEIKKQVKEHTTFDMPEGFLKKHFEYHHEHEHRHDEKEGHHHEHDHEKEFQKFKDELHWLVILENITENQGIKVEEQEIEIYARYLISNHIRNSGYAELPPHELEKQARKYLANDNNYLSAKLNIKEEKVLNYLSSIAHPQMQNISVDEFKKMLSSQIPKGIQEDYDEEIPEDMKEMEEVENENPLA